jgi:uncharacterized SAM-binding protein YcdF (DUF218 family)
MEGRVKWLERVLSVRDDPLPKVADAVIGIGIDVSKDGKSASPYSQAVAWKALNLFRYGIVWNVLFTGGYAAGELNEAQAMGQLVANWIPVEKLFLEQKSFRTFLNADYTLPIVQEEGWERVIIVAQQWHARRVKATFKKRWAGTGIKIYIVKAWSDYGGGSQSRLNHFFTFALWDTLAFVISKIKGYC